MALNQETILMTGDELEAVALYLYGPDDTNRSLAHDLSERSGRSAGRNDTRRIAEMLKGRRIISRFIIEALTEIVDKHYDATDEWSVSAKKIMLDVQDRLVAADKEKG